MLALRFGFGVCSGVFARGWHEAVGGFELLVARLLLVACWLGCLLFVLLIVLVDLVLWCLTIVGGCVLLLCYVFVSYCVFIWLDVCWWFGGVLLRVCEVVDLVWFLCICY